METDSIFSEADIISVYTRAQALQDGTLIDVSETAKEAGFVWPVAVTQNLWSKWIEPSAQAQSYGQDLQGRLWDVLWMARCACRTYGGTHITFSVIFQDGPKKADRHIPTLWAISGPGDDAKPVITIMLPEDY